MNKLVPISVIIPSQNFSDSLKRVLEAINKEEIKPSEIVIVDSSLNNSNKSLVSDFKSSLNINFLKVQKAYPGEARNIGAMNANQDILLFLDSKTVPSKKYVEKYYNLFSENRYKVIFGRTFYHAGTDKQKIVKAATFGSIGHESTPGTMLLKKTYDQVGGFLQGVRRAEDLEWRERVKKIELSYFCPEDPILNYSDVPSSYREVIYKYFYSSFHAARVNVEENIKSLYLSFALILSALIIPRWNYIVGWENENLYIPNITKIYLFSLIVILISSSYFNRALISKSFTGPVSFYLKLIIFIFISLGVYNWNFSIAGWVEEASLYIPHVTKIYLSLILVFSVLYRGIYSPLRLEEERDFLFPLKWIKVSILGLGLDLAKIPGYVLGGLIHPFLFLITKK